MAFPKEGELKYVTKSVMGDVIPYAEWLKENPGQDFGAYSDAVIKKQVKKTIRKEKRGRFKENIMAKLGLVE